MKVVFISNSNNTIEAKSAWQNFLKGKMGKGKSLKELSVEFKKLQKEGKLDDEGNVIESGESLSIGGKKKKGASRLSPGKSKKKKKSSYRSRNAGMEPVEKYKHDIKIKQEMLKLQEEVLVLRRKLLTSYSMKQLIEKLNESGVTTKNEHGVHVIEHAEDEDGNKSKSYIHNHDVDSGRHEKFNTTFF